MTAKILDGRACADTIHSEVSRIIDNLDRPPRLDVILVGDDPASAVYVGAKEKACAKVGMASNVHRLGADISQEHLFSFITDLNENDEVDGILLQLPLPGHLDAQPLLEHIAVAKDVDGFHPYHMGRLCLRLDGLEPCTPKGIIRLLHTYNIPMKGKHVVVVGASNHVGRPALLEFLREGATVTICHRFTDNLDAHVQLADIVVVAAGKPGLVHGDAIKPGAVVVDVGVNRLDDGRLVGDVDYDSAAAKAAWITPVPGGIGPMTIAMLLQNTLNAALERRQA